MSDHGRHAGFTLIELLAAIAVLAILATLSYRGLSESERAASRALDESARWLELGRVFERMRDDLVQATPRPRRRSDGGHEPPWLGLDGGAAGGQIMITRRAGVASGAEQRIGYRLRGGRLELLLWPAVDDNGQAPTVHVLLDGVADFRLAYLGAMPAWVATWPPSGSWELPRAVSIRMTMTDGRHYERVFAIAQ